jgi:hypothetical protein
VSVARLVLAIDELVLHGVAPNDRHALADALKDELGRLFLESGATKNWSSVPALQELRARAIWSASDGAAQQGRAVAAAVHRSLIDSTAPAPAGATQGGRR